METPEVIKTERGYDEDVFGNKSSSRKDKRRIITFTLVLIVFMVLPVCIRMTIDGLKDFSMDWSIFAFLVSIVLILFTAAFAPTSFAQTKEWTAFIQTFQKK